MNFFQTVMGRKFYESDVPRLIKALEKIGNQLEKLNGDSVEFEKRPSMPAFGTCSNKEKEI